MAEKLLSILCPLFLIVSLGYVIGRRRKPDLSTSNALTLDVFAPALIISVLSAKEFHVLDYLPLAAATAALIVFCGLLGWAAARWVGASPRTLLLPMMFNNCANLGIPLAVLAFGQAAMAPAVVMFLVTNLIQFSFGPWLLDRNTRLVTLWKIPTVAATVAGVLISLFGIPLWTPLQTAIRMVGEIVIPMMLFSLGVRIAGSEVRDVRFGLVGGILRSVGGAVIAALVARAMELPPRQADMLIVYGTLPPAVINFMFAERYGQEPAKVASMVFLGHFVSLLTLPVVLMLVLSP